MTEHSGDYIWTTALGKAFNSNAHLTSGVLRPYDVSCFTLKSGLVRVVVRQLGWDYLTKEEGSTAKEAVLKIAKNYAIDSDHLAKIQKELVTAL